jgi:hypothetical protein
LKKVLGEQKLGTTGIFDQKTIASVGKILGIEAMITGSISDLGEEIKIHARLIAVDSAKVFAAASVKIPKDKTTLELLHQGGRAYAPNAITSGLSRSEAAGSFENNTLRIEVQSAGYTKGEGAVNLALKITNKTSDGIYIASGLRDSGTACDLSVADDQGNSAKAPQRDVSGLTCIYSNVTNDRGNYMRIDPSTQAMLLMAFNIDSPGESLNFSGGFWIFQESGTPIAFTVGIPNIRLSKREH